MSWRPGSFVGRVAEKIPRVGAADWGPLELSCGAQCPVELGHRGLDHHLGKTLVETVRVIEELLELRAGDRDEHDVGTAKADELEVGRLRDT
jgi:hypothetical protein